MQRPRGPLLQKELAQVRRRNEVVRLWLPHVVASQLRVVGEDSVLLVVRLGVVIVLLVLSLVKSMLIIILFYETLLLLSIFILCRVYARLVLEWVIIIRAIKRALVHLLLFVDILKVL